MSRNKALEKQINKILVEHGLDFTIEKEPLTGASTKRNTPYYGLFNSKTGNCINTCKEGYRVSQNDEIIELVLEGIKPFGDKLQVYRAASINDGRKVFVQLEITGLSKVGKDTIKKYITVIDSNDGSTGLSVGIGDLTVSCMNQFFKFYKKGEAKFRHTATLDEKIKTIPLLIETALAESLRQIKIYKMFESTAVSKRLVHKCVNSVLGYDRLLTPTENPKSLLHMNGLYDHIEKEMAQKGKNLWGLHSGVTSWTTHELQRVVVPKRKDRSRKPRRENAALESMVNGVAYKYNERSMLFAAKKAKITEDQLALAPIEYN